jgi:hypothetical protein
MAGNTHEEGGRRRGRWRSALWAIAALLLFIPFVAGWPWTSSDYVFAAVLMFGSLGLYELAARLTGNTAYRTGAAIAIAATFLLVWVNGAVGITDSDADGLLLLVPAVGFIGALVARFQPRGMAVAMFTAAVVVVAIVVIALIAGIVPAFNSAFSVLGLAGFFGMMFVGSGLLFHEAARQRASVDVEASG